MSRPNLQKDNDDAFENFMDAVSDYKADRVILNEPKVAKLVGDAKEFGKNLGYEVEDLLKGDGNKRPPVIPHNFTTLQTSAFVGSNDESTQDEVNRTFEDKLPDEKTGVSKIFDKTSYSVRGLTLSANYKPDRNSKASLFVGKYFGGSWQKTDGQVRTNISFEHNVHSNKNRLNYSYSNPEATYGVSLFNECGNNGLTASYDKKNFGSAFSIDENSATLRVSKRQEYSDCKVEYNLYGTTGHKYSNWGIMCGMQITIK